ncbi:hypothetical protein JOD20_001853 [Herpetosiphon giganteus]|nr:hypothetical protein [Herpetosiphon giganteus]
MKYEYDHRSSFTFLHKSGLCWELYDAVMAAFIPHPSSFILL